MKKPTPITDRNMVSVIPNIIDHPDAIHAVPVDFCRRMELMNASLVMQQRHLVDLLRRADVALDDAGIGRNGSPLRCQIWELIEPPREES